MDKPLTRERLDEIELALAQLGELQVECVYGRSEEDLIGNELQRASDGKTIADSFNADLLRIDLDVDEDRSIYYDAGTLYHFNAIVTVVDAMKDAIAEIKRLREFTEWRPIETAPKDGTYILLYFPGPLYDQESKGVAVGRYYDEDKGYWWVTAVWPSGRAHKEPTLWLPLPLPEPPQETK